MNLFGFRIAGLVVVMLNVCLCTFALAMNARAESQSEFQTGSQFESYNGSRASSSAKKENGQRYLDSTSDLAIKIMPASGKEDTKTKKVEQETLQSYKPHDLTSQPQRPLVQPYGIDAILKTPERKVRSLQVTPAQSKDFETEAIKEAGQNTDTYKLGNGDRLKIIVYGEPDLSGELSINSDGLISMPLVGDILLAGKTASDAQEIITLALKGGYLKKPNVSVEVISRRPFYIIGEVRKPGSYSYIDGMSVLKAIAISGGFTYRADRETVEILRGGEANVKPFEANISSAVKPGDIVIVQERFF